MSDLRLSPAELGQMLLDRVPSSLAYFDAALRCCYANRAYAAQAGLDAQAAIGRSMLELLGPEVFETRRARIQAALAGHAQSFEHTRDVAGERRHLLVNYLPDVEDGHVRGMFVEVTDVSAQRGAEQAQRHSDARFRTLSESSPLGVFFADRTGRRTYMNARWREIYGLPGDLGAGDGWMNALHEADRARVVQAWRAMAADGLELELSFRIRRGGDGEVRVLRTRARPVRDEADQVLGFVGVLEDITDRRAAEERLRASEQFLDRSGRVAKIGGWEVDLRTRQVRWTHQTRRICEVDDAFEPAFMGGERFYPPQAWSRLTAAIEAATRDGTPWDLELPFVTARGRALQVRVIGEVEREGGVTVRLVGVMQDVTEQHLQREVLLAEQGMRRASERHAAELDRLLNERSEMLDVLAHEIRQPLNNASAALQGAVGELHDRLASAPLVRAQGVLGQVMTSIDNLLAVASQLARPGLLQPVDTDIDTLVQVSIAEVLPADRSRIQVQRDTDARSAPMDMSLMRLALRNLLSNALRYSPPGSPVTLRVGDSDEPLGLVFDVCNEGGPISAAGLARLFERGTLRQPGDMSPSHGLGLGLYIVRRVMDLHGGSAELLANGNGLVAFRLILGVGSE